MKRFEGNLPEAGSGNKEAVWNTLGKLIGCQEASHSKLVNKKMGTGQGPGGFFSSSLEKGRDLLEEMGYKVHNAKLTICQKAADFDAGSRGTNRTDTVCQGYKQLKIECTAFMARKNSGVSGQQINAALNQDKRKRANPERSGQHKE